MKREHLHQSFLFVVIIGLVFQVIFLFITQSHGWDASVYCSAVNAYKNGQNPYLVQNLGQPIQMNYQPIFLDIFRFLCSPLSYETTYPFIFLGILLLCVWIITDKKGILFSLTLAVGCFYAFGWAIQSGNFVVLELFIFTVGLYFLKKKKWEWSGLFFGFAACMKLLPLIYIFTFLILPEKIITRLKAILFGLIGFSIPLIFSYLFHPSLMNDYINQLMGKIPGQVPPFLEGGGMSDPAFARFFSDVFHINSSSTSIIIISIIFSILFGLPVLYFLLRVISPLLSTEERSDWVFAAVFILITLLMPRLKPYTFIDLFPVFYLLARKEDYIRHLIIIGLCVLLPVGIYDLHLIYLHFRLDIPRFLGLLFDFGQTLSLLLGFIVLILLKGKKYSLIEGKQVLHDKQ
jgi:hypothetical protein